MNLRSFNHGADLVAELRVEWTAIPRSIDQRVDRRSRGDPMCPGDAVTSREWRHKAASQGLSYVYSLTHDAYKCFECYVLNRQRAIVNLSLRLLLKRSLSNSSKAGNIQKQNLLWSISRHLQCCNPTNWVLGNITHQFQATRCKCCSILLD